MKIEQSYSEGPLSDTTDDITKADVGAGVATAGHGEASGGDATVDAGGGLGVGGEG
jgi:hypothetical protein